VLNITKTNIIKFTPQTTVQVPLAIYYRDNVIDEVKSIKFLGMHIDNRMKWKYYVEKILPKLSGTCFSIRNLIHTLNPDILRMVYCVLSFSTSIQNNLLGKFNTCTSSI
jgi:hypothetical protein